MSFSDFNLNKDFIKSIEESGYKSPTELQTQLIPLVAERKSALIWSQSASGKTGAFLIPAMNYILENPAPEKRGARVLILTSRRDRVSQINYTIKRLSNDLVMRFGFIVSGRPYQTQMRLMRRPLDIMIATPGRLNDLMNNGKADFSQLEMLIIDDLSSIYKKNLQGLVENILQQADPDCSSITFVRGDEEITPYATSLFPDAVQITVDEEEEEEKQESNEVMVQQEKQQPRQKVQKNSKEEVSAKKTAQSPNKNANNDTKKAEENIKKVDIKSLMPQKVHIADDYTHKIAMMDYLMDEFSGESTLIYTATNKAAKTLQENLANHGHTAELISELNAEEFDECDILIYSDQENNSFSNEELQTADTNIINFDLPHKTENYLKRLEHHNQDRKKPTLLIIDGYNFNELKHLEKTFGEKLPLATIPGLEPLKPFVNLSKPKPNNRSNQPKRNQNGKKNLKPKNPKNAKNAKNPRRTKPGGRANPNNNTQKAADGTATSRRQHKGPFGRLNGGTHRKNNGKKVGVSRVGTDAPKDSGRGWQSDFAEPKERSADKDKPAVAIRYSKKRSLSVKRPKEIESPDPD
ncbi:DEAD/DEAH box helicase [uncultured Cocleimonas sp.]|uniref:DEAD/DEAH box helicase n=1 Tax=uncultured Cocleimonas sp. TaxID=1051587 RepID=UPI00263206C7|nr:DEAD/DEAH box helicase [uncultured Cocleimonas sp.]